MYRAPEAANNAAHSEALKRSAVKRGTNWSYLRCYCCGGSGSGCSFCGGVVVVDDDCVVVVVAMAV
jgi:hypothetical protein